MTKTFASTDLYISNVYTLLDQINHIMNRLRNFQKIEREILQDYIFSFLPRLRSNMVRLLRNIDDLQVSRVIFTREEMKNLIDTYNGYKGIFDSLSNESKKNNDGIFPDPVRDEFLEYTDECISDYQRLLKFV